MTKLLNIDKMQIKIDALIHCIERKDDFYNELDYREKLNLVKEDVSLYIKAVYYQLMNNTNSLVCFQNICNAYQYFIDSDFYNSFEFAKKALEGFRVEIQKENCSDGRE